ncbi:MAG: sugar phosphate isomerase/epimerase [Deltaproteobacteria bacterium]|jgi:sugar phosphate isomerase/epimerase|nr:sugar phosphate isomerase/epimerase [Deltaproteobacteria bacterium]
MNNPILISTAAYDGYDLATAFKEIARAGVDLVEVAFIEGYTDPFTEEYFNDENAAKILALLAEHNLKCLSFSSHVDLSRDGIVEVFKNRMAFAKRLGAKFIVSNAAPLQNKSQFMQNIRELGQTAAGLKMVILLENPGDGQANVMDSGEPAANLIEEIGQENVKINYDFGNLLSHCFEKIRPEQDYKFVRDCAMHYHIKDVASEDSGWYFTEIGKGSIDYQKILKELAALSEPVPISLEIPLRISRAPDASPRRAALPVDIKRIRQVMEKSVAFAKRALAE